MLTRRQFIKHSLSAGACAGLTACGTQKILETTNSQVEENHQEIFSKKLPANFEHYRIAFVSDLHHGPFLQRKWLDDTLKIINGSNPDLVLLGGDYLSLPESFKKKHLYPWHNSDFSKSSDKDEIIAQVYLELSDLFAQMKAKDGCLAIFGNHDRWLAPQICPRSFQSKGIDFLLNQNKLITRGKQYLEICGVDDYWTGFPRCQFKNQQAYKILLTHNPDFAADQKLNNSVSCDLALAGHTHGGQIILPVIGALSYNVRDLDYIYGLQPLANSQIYTSKGIGVVEVPYRYNCNPEVAILTLRRAV